MDDDGGRYSKYMALPLISGVHAHLLSSFLIVKDSIVRRPRYALYSIGI